MKTVTLSTRLNQEEAQEIESYAAGEGIDRSTLLKQLIRKGFTQMRFQAACGAYRKGSVSLSRAAEIARISLHEMILRLPEGQLELNYGTSDLADDLKTIEGL